MSDTYNVQIIRTHEEFSYIAKQWDHKLSQYDEKALHLTSDYISAIWLADNGALDPYIIIIYKDDDIVAFTALDKSRYDYRFMSIKAALPLDYMRYGRSDAVVFDEKVAPLLYDIVKNIGVDIWHLDRFSSQSPFLKYCEDNLSRSEYYPYEDYELAVLNTQMSWEEYLASKSKNFRRTYKRMQESSSSLHAQLYADSNINAEKIIRDICDVNEQSWRNVAGSNFSKDPKRLKFIKNIIQAAAQKETLVASILYDGDKAVAFTLGIISNGTLYALETGYISEYTEQSAGILSYAILMKHAFDVPMIKACDMDSIRANGGYKKRWATAINQQKGAMILFGGIGSFWIRLGRHISEIKRKIV